MDQSNHIPVLYHEVLELLQPRPGGQYIDGTLGAGGHTTGLLEASAPDGRVLVFDRDTEAIQFTQRRLRTYGERVVFINASYAMMNKVSAANGFTAVKGIILDLGLSSRQLADAGRGFSFLREGPLDMRFDSALEENSGGIAINNSNEDELAAIFRRYGEVKRSGYLANLIAANRPFHTTTELAELVKAKIGQRGRIHPATQLFQALRIAVNDAAGRIQRHTSGNRCFGSRRTVAIISFHSLEDRIVKHTSAI